jgi:hypothetical protein
MQNEACPICTVRFAKYAMPSHLANAHLRDYCAANVKFHSSYHALTVVSKNIPAPNYISCSLCIGHNKFSIPYYGRHLVRHAHGIRTSFYESSLPRVRTIVEFINSCIVQDPSIVKFDGMVPLILAIDDIYSPTNPNCIVTRHKDDHDITAFRKALLERFDHCIYELKFLYPSNQPVTTTTLELAI